MSDDAGERWNERERIERVRDRERESQPHVV